MLCIGYAQSASDEGFASAERDPSPVSISLRSIFATLSHKGRGEEPPAMTTVIEPLSS
jgi:hypothetical protein